MIIKKRGPDTALALPSRVVEGVVVDAAWEDAPTVFTRRNVFMLITGETGTGRTSLALTAPGPIAFAHTAEKIDGVIQTFALTKQIRTLNFGGTFTGTPQDIANAAGPVWNRMYQGWTTAQWAKTVVMDTDTEAWEVLRLARFGMNNPKGNRMDHLYGPVNAEWRSLWKCHREHRNVIAISQNKDEWVDKMKDGKLQSVRTGRTVRTGQKEMGYMADVVIETVKDPMAADGGFKAVIRKGWFNAMTEGDEITGADVNFAYIMSYITGTDEAEWK